MCFRKNIARIVFFFCTIQKEFAKRIVILIAFLHAAIFFIDALVQFNVYDMYFLLRIAQNVQTNKNVEILCGSSV